VVVFLQLKRVWQGSSGAQVPAATPMFDGSRRPATAALQQDAEVGVQSSVGPPGVAD